jgi:hypothetical protein
MHTGNLLGQISPLPSEVFADLVSTNNVRIERSSPRGRPLPESGSIRMNTNGYCWCREKPSWSSSHRIPGYRNASIWGRGLHQHPGAPSAQGGVDPSDRDNRLALRLLLASSRLKKAMLLLRRSKRRPWRQKPSLSTGLLVSGITDAETDKVRLKPQGQQSGSSCQWQVAALVVASVP